MRLKYYGMALVPACLAVFLFRAVELILAIDPRTGYFSTGALLPLLFDIFLIAVALFFCSVLFLKREPKPAVVRLYRASLFDTILGIAGSILLMASSLYNFLGDITIGRISSPAEALTAPSLWQLILAVLTAVFLIFFVTYPRKSAKQNLWRILSLSVTAYYLSLLIINFKDLDVVFSRAFGIYLITFYGLTAAASINFSKILARLFGRKPFILFTCLMTVLISVRFADAVLSLIPGNPYAISIDLFPFLGDVCITLLFLSQMKKLMIAHKRKHPAPQPEADSPAAAE